MALTACHACPRLLAAADDAIVCAPPACPLVRTLPLNARLGGDVCVGAVAGEETILVHEEVPSAEVVSMLTEHGVAMALVAQDEGLPLGVVHIEDAASARRATSASRVARRISPVHEAAPLAHAIERMVRERARGIPIVNDEGRALALLTDLDALAWVARRTKSEDAPEAGEGPRRATRPEE
jgi:CBS domain-containing protein